MVKAAFLSSDSRLSFQVKDWFREIDNQVRLETYTSLKGFLSHLDQPVGDVDQADLVALDQAQDSAAESKDSEAGLTNSASIVQLEPKTKTPFRLLIVDLDLVDQKPFQWLTEVRKILASKGFSDPILPVKILALAFEGGRHTVDHLRHESIDDLVLKPLDRSLFLQKVELLVADKADVQPSFLYRMKTAMVIEAGKDAVIDEISEFAVAIRNPAPLAEGIYATLYSDVFGSLTNSRLIGRVYQNSKHPSIEDEYLVRFAFYGINPTQLSNIRKYVRAHHVPMKLRHASLGERSKRMIQQIPPEDMKRVAVIDMNRECYSQIKSTLETNYRNLSVEVFPSYSRFLAGLSRLLPMKNEASTTTPAPNLENDRLRELQRDTRPAAFPHGRKMTFVIADGTYDLVRTEPALRTGEKLFGRDAEHWKDHPDLWHSSVLRDDREEFDEFLSYIGAGAKGHTAFRMTDADGYTVYLEAHGSLEKSGDVDGLTLMRLDVQELDRQRWHEQDSELQREKGAQFFHFDVIIIDGAVLRADVDSWKEGLKDLMVRAGVLRTSEAFPKIFILADEKSAIKPDAYRSRALTHFIFKPIDRKYLTDLCDALLPKLIRKEELESPHFVPCEIPARLAKNIMMSEVSEFGIAVNHATPFRPGVYMRFFSPLFGGGSEGVIGKSTFAAAVGDGDKQVYRCLFTFFGVSDELNKRIRTWIREDYVHKKEGAAS